MDFTDHNAELKSGNEKLYLNNEPLDFSLLDFWRWSFSDILSNTTRGIFAEFIVASALSIDITKVRNEWDAFDLKTNDDIKIEVKTSAYLQSWQQLKYSDIRFSTNPAKAWDNEINKRSDISARSADVYVFCILKHKEKSTVNPLNLNQWEFYVVSTIQLNNTIGNQKTIGINSLKKLTAPVDYSELEKEVKSKSLFTVLRT